MSGIGGLAVVADRVQVGALVFGAVAGVAEGLLAAGVLAQVGLLPRVAAQVDLQVLQPREGLGAALELQGTHTDRHRVTPRGHTTGSHHGVRPRGHTTGEPGGRRRTQRFTGVALGNTGLGPNTHYWSAPYMNQDTGRR